MSCWRWVSKRHGEPRVRHPLHGMSVPHMVSEKQMLESYHPLTSWKTLAGVRLQQRLPTQDFAATVRGWEPNYPTHFCLSWTVKVEVHGQWWEMEARRDRMGLILMKTPPVGAGGTKMQQGHGVCTLLPSWDQLNHHPKPLGHLPSLQNPPCRCMAGKREKKKSSERKSFKMSKIKN